MIPRLHSSGWMEIIPTHEHLPDLLSKQSLAISVTIYT